MPFCGTAEAGAQVALSGPQTRSDRLVRRVPVKVLKSMLKSRTDSLRAAAHASRSRASARLALALLTLC